MRGFRTALSYPLYRKGSSTPCSKSHLEQEWGKTVLENVARNSYKPDPLSGSVLQAMIEIIRYTSAKQLDWDAFVQGAKNGTFLFQRAYQDYHADRFPDHSYMFLHNGELTALLPASRIGLELSSHGGLTFGGILSDARMTTPLMLEIFDSLLPRLREDGIERFIYKSCPAFYHVLPADEDAYALVRHGARLFRRDVTSILHPAMHPDFQQRRQRSIKKAMNAGLEVRESADIPSFWKILEETLHTRHGIKPVHTLKEIQVLHQRFPANIRLFAAFARSDMLAGTLVFETPRVAHTQYSASSLAGREASALDLLFSELILRVFFEKLWFSFGISTEDGGRALNQGLIKHKEGFGARACVQDFYELNLKE